MSKNLFSSINARLFPMKMHYFLFHLGTGPIFANMSIIARQQGFSSGVLGVLLTVLNLLAMISRPAFGWLADRFKLHKSIFLTMQTITGLSFFLIYFVPPFASQVKVRTILNNTEIFFCPRNPVWDNCFDDRIQNYESKIFKCQLSCKPETWMRKQFCDNNNNDDCISNMKPFQYEIFVDMRTIEKNATCLTMREFKNISHLNAFGYFDEAPLYAKMYDVNCEINCEDHFLKSSLVNRGTLPDDEITQKYDFWLFCGLLLLAYSAASVVMSMADTICFDLLGEDSHLYGKQKMFDSVGAGTSAVVVGAIIDIVSGHSLFKNYSIVYFFCLASVSLNMIWSMKLNFTQSKQSQNIMKDVGKLFKSIKIVTFFSWCCFAGIFSAVIWSFVFWHLEELSDEITQNECGGNYIKTLEGLSMFTQTCIGEIPVFFWSGYLLKKLGHVNCMHLIFGAFIARLFYYSLLSNPWWVLPIELLNGITYGLLLATMASYANYIAQPGMEATVQGLVGAFFQGVGVSVGNFLAGTLFEFFGGSIAFMIFGVLGLSAFIVHVLVHVILKTKFF
ncbi:major facilitator superfamily domain-containing protein 6-like [Condylostylus longicornis]|uniref:major facilitator superfamily domain-containing protein 6-like n=1 Tax=Condylostylus longicornis TaxID=2530218 RepID=UPI00244E5993|nr:major facilitator superfamily domain-containing protein 6-like [Condylostylus longicornis]